MGTDKTNKPEENTDCFSSYFCTSHYDCINIYGPRGSGKALFLEKAREFCGIDESEIQREHGDKHPIIFLDFSDFCCVSFDDALCYFRAKMSELYISYIETCGEELTYRKWEQYLDVLEGRCDEKKLKKSLLELVYHIRFRYRWNNRRGISSENPLILIDEISKPLLYAANYNFLSEMQEFLDGFLEIDHYELTAGIITTSYAPINTDVFYDLKYIRNEPVNNLEPLKHYCLDRNIPLDLEFQNMHYSYCGRRFFSTKISLEECFSRMKEEYETVSNSSDTMIAGEKTYLINISKEMRSFISDKRHWIEEARKADIEAENNRIERERQEYAASLPENCIIPSQFAGVRELHMDITDQYQYEKINDILKGLFDAHGRKIVLHDVYDAIQGFRKKEKKTKRVTSTIDSLKTYADSLEKIYSCWTDTHDDYWGKIDIKRVEHEKGYGDMALIKVYISVSDRERIIEVFEDIIRFLIDKGEHVFHSKVSRFERNDHICLWVGREDFFLLEKYIYKYDNILFTPLTFVAYRGKLGISREFYSWDSHNGVQSGLICTYLKTIDSREKIDLIDMYKLFVRGWNGDLDEDHPLTKEFKKENAQALLILLESLNVILGNEVITDDHLLLNGDGDFWMKLGQSKNWFEVGENICCDLAW